LEKNKKFLEFLKQEQINQFFKVLIEINCMEACANPQKKFEPTDTLYKFTSDDLNSEFVGKMTKRFEQYRKIVKILQNSKTIIQLFDKFQPDIEIKERNYKFKKVPNCFIGKKNIN
jgi:hypothetical protein